MIKFFDTCALLDLQQDAFKTQFLVSNITFSELENIKSSGTKDEEIKWKARQLLHLLEQYDGNYKVIRYDTKWDNYIEDFGLISNNDSRIIVTAYDYDKSHNDEVEFITSDLSCKAVANSIGLKTKYLSSTEDLDNYTGFQIIDLPNEELAKFYNVTLENKENVYSLKENEYLLIKNEGTIVDKYKWTKDGYVKINFLVTDSRMFGKISPKDSYQQIALDSLNSNKITMLRGKAGTGKSLLAFGQMFSMLERGKIDKIIVFCNTVATKGSAKLGFYPGSRTEKLLDSQIGNLLESKLGSRIEVEKLIDDGDLILLPLSDIRGYDTTGMHACVYISEAQNLDVELMRLALQRIGEDSYCIIDGDFSHQVDLSAYAGNNNGMRRASQVFRGHGVYGEIELQNIYRSEIGRLAEKM